MRNATLSDSDLTKIYTKYNDINIPDTDFKSFCIELIENARQPNEKIIRDINRPLTSRDKVLSMINNFVLKGTGDGVI